MSEKSPASRLSHALPYVGVLVGIVVLLSPVIADLIESWRARGAVSEVTTMVEQIDEADRAELLRQAQAYNEELATHVANKDVWSYERQLSQDSSQVMCWVEIPRIDVRLAVYHGTGEDELMAGVGHVEGTSLPVGGASTHCALSAHSGMPTARMFDNIHDLVPGDVFIVWTLGEPLAYRVVGSETVTPDDMSSLGIESDKDLCTLITCTPYGVNSHRLLVHGERCAYEEVAQEEAPALYVSPHAWPLVAGLVGSGAALAVASWCVVRERRKKGAHARQGTHARGSHA